MSFSKFVTPPNKPQTELPSPSGDISTLENWSPKEALTPLTSKKALTPLSSLSLSVANSDGVEAQNSILTLNSLSPATPDKLNPTTTSPSASTDDETPVVKNKKHQPQIFKFSRRSIKASLGFNAPSTYLEEENKLESKKVAQSTTPIAVTQPSLIKNITNMHSTESSRDALASMGLFTPPSKMETKPALSDASAALPANQSSNNL